MDVTKTFMNSPKLGYSFNSNPWMLRQGKNRLADFPATNLQSLIGWLRTKQNEALDTGLIERATAYVNMITMIDTAAVDTVNMFPKKHEEPRKFIEIDASIPIPIWLLKGILGDWILPYAIHSYIPGFSYYSDSPSINFIEFKCSILDLVMYLRTIAGVETKIAVWAIHENDNFDVNRKNVISRTCDIDHISNVFVDENDADINLHTFQCLYDQINASTPIDPGTQFPMIIIRNKENILKRYFDCSGYSGYNGLKRITEELFKDTSDTNWEMVLPTLWQICRTLGKSFMTNYNLVMNGFLYNVDVPYYINN